MKNGQKLKLGDAHVTPRNIQELQASKLGDAPKAPLLHRQKSGHLSKHYIFIASCTMRFFLERLYFCFMFSFVLLAAINGWTPTNFFWRRCTRFSFAKNTPFFTLIINECSLLLELQLAFIFALIFVQILFYICIKVYLDL
jgi:hypothetical protein